MKKEYIVYKLSECAKQACRIDNELFTKYNVKRGLRNEDGTGNFSGYVQGIYGKDGIRDKRRL